MRKYNNVILYKSGKGSKNALKEEMDSADSMFASDMMYNDKTIKYFMTAHDRIQFILSNANKPTLYEVILSGSSTTFVCDIDGCPIFEKADFSEFEDTFIKHASTVFSEEFTYKFVWLQANKPPTEQNPNGTGSYHVIIHARNGLGFRVGFKTFTEQKYFWHTFPRQGKFANINDKSVIDCNIYSEDRCFRCVCSSKLGQDRPLKPMGYTTKPSNSEIIELVDDSFVIQPIVIFLETPEIIRERANPKRYIDNLDCGKFANQIGEIRDILYKSPRAFKTFKQWLALLFKVKYLVGQAGGQLVADFLVTKGFSSQSDMNETIDKFNEISPSEPCTIEEFRVFCNVPEDITVTEDDIRELLGTKELPKIEPVKEPVKEPLVEVTLDLTPQQVEIREWLAFTSIEIKSEKFALKLASVLKFFLGKQWNIAVDFFQAKLGESKFLPAVMSQLEKKVTTQYQLYELIDMLKVDCLKWDETYADKRMRTYPDLDGSKHLLIRGGTGLGKTHRIIEQYGTTKRILILCYRRMLVRDLIGYKNKIANIDIGHYQEVGIENRMPNIFLCQVESLHKFDAHISTYDIIIFDECENIISQFDNIAVGSALNRSRIIFEAIIKHKQCVFISANLGVRTFNFIKKYSNKPIYAIKNEILDKADYTVEIYLGWEEKVKALAKAGKKLCMPVNTVASAERMASVLGGIVGKDKVLLMTSKTASRNEEIMADINSEWKKYDIVVYSSCVEAGVSFDECHFDYICGKFAKGANHHLSCYQSLFRCRNPINKTIILSIDKDIKDDKYHPLNRRDLIHAYSLKKFARTISIDDRMAYRAKDLFKLEVNFNDPMNLQLIENIGFNLYSQAFLKSLLLNELQVAGCKIVQGDEKRELRKTGKDGEMQEAYVRSESEKVEKKQATETLKKEKISNVVKGETKNDQFQRELFTKAGVINKEDTVEESTKKMESIQKQYQSVDSASKAIINYNKFHKLRRMFAKRKYLLATKPKSEEHAIEISRRLAKYKDIDSHNSMSANIAVCKIYEIVVALGTKNESCGSMLGKMKALLLKDKNYELYNKVFKSRHPANWITPAQINSDDSKKKILAYFRGILKSYNMTFDPEKENPDVYKIRPIVKFETRSMEIFANKMDKYI